MEIIRDEDKENWKENERWDRGVLIKIKRAAEEIWDGKSMEGDHHEKSNINQTGIRKMDLLAGVKWFNAVFAHCEMLDARREKEEW
jgi:hypothetical protein